MASLFEGSRADHQGPSKCPPTVYRTDDTYLGYEALVAPLSLHFNYYTIPGKCHVFLLDTSVGKVARRWKVRYLYLELFVSALYCTKGAFIVLKVAL